MTVIDLSSDRGFVHFARLTNSLLELPDFVKEASTDSCKAPDGLHANAFADTINRKFPVHTKAAAFLSYLYFEDQKDKFTKEAVARIRSKFDSASEVWGIRTEIGLAKQAMTPVIEKTAAVASDYALSAGGEFFFPINDAVSVVKSAASLIECRGNFPYEMRKEAATEIMKAAVTLGFKTIDLPEELHRMAGFGLCEKEAAVKEVGRRFAYAAGAHSPLSKQMAKLASDLENADELLPTDMTKIASIIDIVDRELKINEQYGESFPFPEDVFFGAFTEKIAADIKANNVAMITGNAYSLDQLSKAADAMRVFGEDFYGDVVRGDGSVDLQKVADVLPTMPRDEAALFDRAMSSVEKQSNDTLDAIDDAAENYTGVRPIAGIKNVISPPAKVKRPDITFNTKVPAATPKAPVVATKPKAPTVATVQPTTATKDV